MADVTEMILRGQAARRRDRAGGKAAVLAELAQHFPVPAFVVLPPQAITEAGLLPAARKALATALAELGPGPFAVRSSGVDEDGAAHAHAGQFDTLLNVEAEDVPTAAEAVWRSGFSDSVAAYRRAHGLDATPQPPAALIQVMLKPEAAGVAFTADPVTGERDVAIVSAVAGLADRLVSGEVDGDVFRVDAGGAVETVQTEGEQPVLSADQARAVAALARRAEAHFGAPQDLEWAIQDGVVHLLQARPITTLDASDAGVSLWDNSNIVESYPGMVSPLTFSFAKRVYGHVYRALAALLGIDARAIAEARPAFETLLGRAKGRVYYNLLAWYRLLALLPGYKANRAFMEQMMGVGEALPAALARQVVPDARTSTLGKLLDQLAVVRVVLGLMWQAIVLPATIRRFYARLQRALSRPDAEIEGLGATALAAEYRMLERRLLERWDAPLVNDLLCMIAFGASRKALERWAGAEGLAVHADTLIGQGDIVSAEPAARIREMGQIARGDAALVKALSDGDAAAVRADPALGPRFQAYLDKFGDRCTEELKLESVTLHEDPTALLAAVAAAARSDGAVHVRPEAGAPALDRLFRGRPVQRLVAGRLLAWAKARVRDRENLRFERTRLFGRVRRIVRTAGARLATAGALETADDVFFLTIEEWLGALEGGAVDRDLKGLVALRRAEFARDAAEPDPPERFEVRGAFVPGLARLRSRVKVDAGDPRLRQGLGCCPGVVTARVRVVTDPRTQALEAGEILVARHTDPGWIAVFANAAGVIAERGSLLSHSAIVAREMGVPCAVGVKGASGWLKTGDRVRLDGAAGTVERLDD